jgi:hypothetical protein
MNAVHRLPPCCVFQNRGGKKYENKIAGFPSTWGSLSVREIPRLHRNRSWFRSGILRPRPGCCLWTPTALGGIRTAACPRPGLLLGVRLLVSGRTALCLARRILEPSAVYRRPLGCAALFWTPLLWRLLAPLRVKTKCAHRASYPMGRSCIHSSLPAY